MSSSITGTGSVTGSGGTEPTGSSGPPPTGSPTVDTLGTSGVTGFTISSTPDASSPNISWYEYLLKLNTKKHLNKKEGLARAEKIINAMILLKNNLLQGISTMNSAITPMYSEPPITIRDISLPAPVGLEEAKLILHNEILSLLKIHQFSNQIHKETILNPKKHLAHIPDSYYKDYPNWQKSSGAIGPGAMIVDIGGGRKVTEVLDNALFDAIRTDQLLSKVSEPEKTALTGVDAPRIGRDIATVVTFYLNIAATLSAARTASTLTTDQKFNPNWTAVPVVMATKLAEVLSSKDFSEAITGNIKSLTPDTDPFADFASSVALLHVLLAGLGELAQAIKEPQLTAQALSALPVSQTLTPAYIASQSTTVLEALNDGFSRAALFADLKAKADIDSDLLREVITAAAQKKEIDNTDALNAIIKHELLIRSVNEEDAVALSNRADEFLKAEVKSGPLLDIAIQREELGKELIAESLKKQGVGQEAADQVAEKFSLYPFSTDRFSHEGTWIPPTSRREARDALENELLKAQIPNALSLATNVFIGNTPQGVPFTPTTLDQLRVTAQEAIIRELSEVHGKDKAGDIADQFNNQLINQLLPSLNQAIQQVQAYQEGKYSDIVIDKVKDALKWNTDPINLHIQIGLMGKPHLGIMSGYINDPASVGQGTSGNHMPQSVYLG